MLERRVTRSMTKKRGVIIGMKFRKFVTKTIIKKRLTNKNTINNKEKVMTVEEKTIHYPDNSFLTELNKHTRDQHIRFQEKGHIYFVKGATGYTSVTTFVHSFSKPFDQDAVIAKILKKEDKGQYEGMNAWQIKKMWRDNGRLACEMGNSKPESANSPASASSSEGGRTWPIEALKFGRLSVKSGGESGNLD